MKKLQLSEKTSYMGVDCVVVAVTATHYTLRGLEEPYVDQDLTLLITSFEESKQEELDNELNNN